MKYFSLNRFRAVYLPVLIAAAAVRLGVFLEILDSPLRNYSFVVGLDMQVFMTLGELFHRGGCQFSFFNALVALCYVLNGLKHWPEAVIAVQMLSGVGAALMVAWLSLHLSGRKLVGLIAGMIAALYAPKLVFESVTLRESVYLFLTLTSLVVLLKFRNWNKTWYPILTGGALILPAFSRFPAILWTAGGILWGVMRLREKHASEIKSKLFRAGVGCLIPVVVILFVNIINSGSYNPFPYSMNLFRIQMSITSSENISQMNPSDEPVVSRAYGHEILRRLKRSAGYFVDIFKPYEICNNINYYFMKQHLSTLKYMPGPLLVAPLALTGMILMMLSGKWWRRKELVLLVYVICFAIPVAAFVPLGRYRLIMFPFFCFFSAWVFDYVFRAFRRKGAIAGVIKLTVAAASFTLISVLVWPGSIPLRASDYITYAKAAEIRAGGITPLAAEYYNQAARLEPDSGAALVNMGRVMLSQGRFSEAEVFTRRAYSLEPGNFGAAMFYVSSLLALGRTAEAENIIDGMSIPVDASGRLTYYYNLGECKMLSGKNSEALSAYRNAWKNAPAAMKKLIDQRIEMIKSRSGAMSD
jgi:hypothetical protein